MEKWSKLKHSLVARVPWLKALEPTLAELVAQEVNNAPLETIRFNPLLVRDLFSQVSDLLDRCVVYRHEARDLEVSAVKAAVDYLQYVDLFDTKMAIEIEALGKGRLAVEQQSAKNAAAGFGEGSPKTLERGFHLTASGAADASTQALGAAERSEALIRKRYEIERKYVEEYHTRYQTPGNAHNYGERLAQLVRFLAQDFQVATMKVGALVEGVNAIYGSKFTAPPQADVFEIDELLLQVRHMSRYVEAQSQLESEVELMVSLAQPLCYSWGGEFDAWIPEKDFLNAVEKGTVMRFNPSPLFAHFERVRILGLGVSFGNDTEYGPSDPSRVQKLSNYKIGLQVEPPQRDGLGWTIQPLSFGEVSLTTAAGPSNAATDDVENIDPRGFWRVWLDPQIHYGARYPISHAQGQWVLDDVKLHLKIAVVRSTARHG